MMILEWWKTLFAFVFIFVIIIEAFKDEKEKPDDECLQCNGKERRSEVRVGHEGDAEHE